MVNGSWFQLGPLLQGSQGRDLEQPVTSTVKIREKPCCLLSTQLAISAPMQSRAQSQGMVSPMMG